MKRAKNPTEKSSDFQSITHAGSALSDDLPGRQKRYFISMMIRTACFILAVFTPSPYRWFFLFGAVVLPYVSVIVANAGRETVRGPARLLGKTKELN